jgi:intracellular septation protein
MVGELPPNRLRIGYTPPMQLLADFLPIALFFIAFKIWGVFVATAAAIVMSVLQVAYYRYKHGKYETTQLITLAMIVVFGGATLLLHNELYIKWKVTAVYALFALILLATQWSANPVMKRLLGAKIDLPLSIWKKLNFSWALFFIVLAGLNLYVAYHFSTDVWVNFKLFGLLGLTLVFILLQAIFLVQHLKQNAK